MSVLVSDMITRVRETVQDKDGDRYSDDRIIGAINLGVLDTRRGRPDLFIGRFDVPTPQYAAGTDEFDLPEIMIPPIVAYVVGWIEMANDEHSDDGRAVAMMKKHAADLGVV